MPKASNKSSPWLNSQARVFAELLQLNDERIFPNAWRSCRKKITIYDVWWVAEQIYGHNEQCMRLVEQAFDVCALRRNGMGVVIWDFASGV